MTAGVSKSKLIEHDVSINSVYYKQKSKSGSHLSMNTEV